MTVEDVRRTHRNPGTRGVMLMLTTLIVLGMLATYASISAARAVPAASRLDVERNAALTRQIQVQQDRAERRTFEVRQDNRVLLEAICAQIEAVSVQAQLEVPECPRLPPIPEPSAAPTPSPTPSPSR